MGLPCISTDCPCGGPREVIENVLNGILIPVGDVDALSEKLMYAYQNSDEMEQMGRIARKRADCFRSDRVFSEWREYVENLVKNKRK